MKKNNFLRTIIKILAIAIGVCIIIYVAWLDHLSNRNDLINKNLSYMKLTAKNTSHNIENYFNEHLEQLLIIAKNEGFYQEVLKCTREEHENHSDCVLNTFYQINEYDLDEIFLVDDSNKILCSSPSEHGKHGKNYFDNILNTRDTTHSPYLSLSLIKDEPEVFLTVPIITNEKQEYSLRILFRSNTIFTNSLKELNSDDTEVWIIDQAGVVISHPVVYHLGKNYIELHKSKYPNVDWSELESHIETMLTGKEDSGIFNYHKSLNKFSKSEKKLIAYAPVFILDEIWSVVVTRHYSELELLTNTHTIKTISFMGILILLFVLGSIIILRSRNKRKLLGAEAGSLRETTVILKALEESTEALLESQKIAQIGSYVLNIKEGKWKSSDVLDEIFGIDYRYKKDIEGWINIVHPDYQKIMMDYLTKDVFTKHKMFDKEYSILKLNDKTERWVHGRGKLEFDDRNNPLRMIGSIQDITERKLAERRQHVLYNITKEAHESEDLKIFLKKVHYELSTLMKVENFYVAIYHEEYDKYTFPYFEDQYDDKFDPDELIDIKESLTDYIRRTAKSLLVNREIENKLKQSNEIKLIGTPSPIYLGSPLIDSKGKSIGVIGIQDYKSEDAYTNKDLELLDFVAQSVGILVEKINTEHALKLSEERMEFALKGADLAYWEWNIQTNEINFNDRWLEMVEYKRGEIDVHGWTWSEWFHPDDLSKAEDLLNKHLDGKTNSYSAEYRVRTKNGKWIWISDHGKVFTRDKDNKAIRMAGIHIDITSKKNHEMELIKAKKKAEEGDRLKTAFLNNISHEIRTPLNGIMGFSEMLNKPDLNELKREMFIENINLCGNQLLRIVDDVIIISKIEAKQVILHKKETCINTLLMDLYDVFKPIATNKNLNFQNKNQLSNEQSTITTDENKIKQIISNLLDNAIKFSSSGTIEFGYILKNGFLEFYVADNGIGINSKFHNLIFERFSQVETDITRNYGGTGLGLAISKAYVELLGGKLWLLSEPEKGSTFYFTIPYVSVVKTEEKNQKIDKSEKRKLNWKNKTILIVEDDNINYQFISEILSVTGANLIHAKTGFEAIKYCQNADISIILMDIKLPDMSGYEVTKTIKKSLKDVPVIAQTAYSLPEDKEKAFNAGCDDYISKPIDRFRLMEILSKYLK